MKVHVKKKQYRAMIHALAREGRINAPDGRMIPRASAADNSMRRDYYPQR